MKMRVVVKFAVILWPFFFRKEENSQEAFFYHAEIQVF